MVKKQKAPSVAKMVEEYLYDRPYLLSLASDGILNTTALARKIKTETKITKTDEAVMISLYRFLEKAQKVMPDTNKTQEIIRSTSVNIHSNYAVLVADIKQDIVAKNIISYSDKQVCIGEQNNLQKYKNKAQFYRDELTLLELKHGREIEDTPGILFHILSKFYEQSISIMEVFSAYDSTYILIRKEDMPKIMKMFF